MPHYSAFRENPMKTREDFQKCLLELVAPLLPALRTGGSLMDLDEGGAHFDMRASSLEGVARPLWGLIPFTVGGGHFPHWDLFRKAIVQGTDPKNPGYWGATSDKDQRSVEMAAFGVLLSLLPEEGWHPLTPAQRENLAQWLAGIQQVTVADNNWVFFCILVQEGLRAVGRDDLVVPEVQKRYLDKVEGWYLGDGWYGDGRGLPIDYYGPFAMHFYSLIYAKHATALDADVSRRFMERANAFAPDFRLWFAHNGACIQQGRSLTYRFATCAFWGVAAVCDINALPMGQMKHLWGEHLRWWRDKPIFTTDGLMTRGYEYPNLLICEEYNSPTSPYWALKAFMPLMLPEDHPFWQAEEEVPEEPAQVTAIPAASSLVQRVAGHSILHYGAPVRREVQSDKYNKFCYSTACGIEIQSLNYADEYRVGDNILCFSFDGGFNWQTRDETIESEVGADTLVSQWRSGLMQVETRIEVLGEGLFRRSHVFVLDRPARVIETGFALNQWYEDGRILVSAGTPDAPVQGAAIMLSNSRWITAISAEDEHLCSSSALKRAQMNTSAPRTMVPHVAAELPAGKVTLMRTFGLWSAEVTSPTQARDAMEHCGIGL